VAVGVGTLIVSWVVYDALCRSPLGATAARLGRDAVVLATALAWGLSQLLSPRAAYLHVGAAIGTIMAANVLMVIIPAHGTWSPALAAGRAPGRGARQAGGAAVAPQQLSHASVLFIM